MQPKNVELVINDLVKVMTDSIANGERIEIRGFGGFSIVLRKARMARNPKTGEQVSLPEHFVVRFTSGQEMRNRVNKSKR